MKRVFPVVISYLDRIPGLLFDHDMLYEVNAKAHRQAGFARMTLGRPKGRDDYREAIRIYEELAREQPGRIWIRTGLIESLHEYSNLVDAARDGRESDAVFCRALDVAQGLIDDKRAAANCFSMALSGAFSDLAWALMRRPPSRHGSPLLASRLARVAADWQPGRADLWFTAGVAHYRNGEFRAARQALWKAIGLTGSFEPGDWYLLAAADRPGADPIESRRRFDRAVDWIKVRPDSRQGGETSLSAGLTPPIVEARRVP
jgi:tetratricopeptide (TPR) repeat protein